MEMIFGVIEDVLDKLEKGTPEEQEDSRNTLKQDMAEFKQNLQPLMDSGNAEATKLLERLNNITL